jgi:hypothetical protein
MFSIDNENKCCNEYAPITHEETIKLKRNTVRQLNSTEWIKERGLRSTASIFAKIAKRKKQVNGKSIMTPEKFTSATTSYGITQETIAKESYAEKFRDRYLHDYRLVVNPSYSFLGATPVGKVCIDSITGIIESKCLYAVRDMKIEQAIEAQHIYLTKEGYNIKINKAHGYYYQVQGQLFVTGAPFCEFIAYTKLDLTVDRVLPDPDFQTTLFKKLCKFYKTYSIPFLQNLPTLSVRVPFSFGLLCSDSTSDSEFSHVSGRLSVSILCFLGLGLASYNCPPVAGMFYCRNSINKVLK